MKQFNLEEYLKNPNKKVVTRDGKRVRIVCTDRLSAYPVIGLVNTDEEEEILMYNDNGHIFATIASGYDLFFAPEKHEGWFNIYHCDDLGFYIRQNLPYKSKEEADEVAKANFRTFFATVKVEWEE